MDTGDLMYRPTTNDFHRIVMEQVPLLDVRAPIEFEKGAFLTSINSPILTNDERHLVGTCYKQKGNAEATKLGYHLVSGDVKEARLQQWVDFFNTHPQGMLYCFRGGSRSRIAQEWICERLGREVIRLEGGYKAFRTYLTEILEDTSRMAKPVILGGYTGSGKTKLLHQLNHSIDLEGIANHRGSSFGSHILPQPTQINFENNLAYALVQHQSKNYKTIVLEDEGRHVGSCYLPKTLGEYFNRGDLVVVDVPLEKRIAITYDEYVLEGQKEYLTRFGDDGLDKWYTFICSCILRVKKRLGGDRTTSTLRLVEEAHQHQLTSGSPQKHESWIKLFLEDYYDPMYQYQLDTTSKKVIFRGNESAVLDYLKSLT